MILAEIWKQETELPAASTNEDSFNSVDTVCMLLAGVHRCSEKKTPVLKWKEMAPKRKGLGTKCIKTTCNLMDIYIYCIDMMDFHMLHLVTIFFLWC